MESQNITLTLPKETLLKVKLLAVRQNTSVSGLLTAELERLVMREDSYQRAMERHWQRLETAPDLGTAGHVTTTREELHER